MFRHTIDAAIMHTDQYEEDKSIATNSRLFKAHVDNSSAFKALNSENKIQAHSRYAPWDENTEHNEANGDW